jgi:membrane protein implicated in regulation of membrane protease activity
MLAYCLTRFSQYGGMASGLTGGGYIISTSAFSFIVVKIININSQAWLGAGYTILILGILALILRTKWIERATRTQQTNHIDEREIGLMME